MSRKGFAVLVGLSGLLPPALAGAADPPPAVTVRLVRPDEQLRQLLALFEGSRAPHPAAALAAWKRATAPRGQLGKPLEAAITALNPEMVAELRSLDQSELVIQFDPQDAGALLWYATLPNDDGTFAALAPALALTEGARDAPLDGLAVDRLGPPGAPLMARSPRGLMLAGSRPALAIALDPGRPPRAALAQLDSGSVLGVNRDGLALSNSLWQRRLAEGLRGLGCTRIAATACLEANAFAMRLLFRTEVPQPQSPTLDPAWLDGMPATGLLAAFAWALDPSAAAWDRAFAVADSVERADPARAGVAPLRTRINVLAAALKVHPEVDLWPHLRGLSGALVANVMGRLDGAVLVLHTASPEAAERIALQVLPRLAPLLGVRADAAPPADDVVPRRLGQFQHRPLVISRREATVRLVWGHVEPGAGQSLAPLLWDPHVDSIRPPQRFVAFWPGRLALAPGVGEPLARTLAEAPPILWSDHNDARGSGEIVRWAGLRDLTRDVLDRLPLDLAADH